MPKYTGDKFGFGKSPDGGGGSSGPDPNYSVAKSATFTQSNTYNWTVPAGVTSVSVLCVGGGGSGGGGSNAGCGGGGGAMVWGNNISVTPGESIAIVVGAGGRPPLRAMDPLGRSYPGGNGEGGGQSYFNSASLLVALGGDGGTSQGGQGGTWSGSLATMGYNGGTGGNYTNGSVNNNNGGGGGAPGNYVANGADGVTNNSNVGDSGGGGGGGVGMQGTGGTGKYLPRWTTAAERDLGGGRRGIDNFTKGGSGTFSAPWGQYSGRFLKDTNSNQQSMGNGGTGGFPGGGGGGNGNATNGANGRGRHGYGADGAVRIVWGGRTFPDKAHDVDQPSEFLLGGDYYYTGAQDNYYLGGPYVDCDFRKPIMDEGSTNWIGNNNPLEAAGVSRIVLNGYGILFYGWHSHHEGTAMHEIELPEFLLNQDIDITFIGGGGYHSGGGGGGGAGAGGGRWYGPLTHLTAYISTGTYYFSNFQGSNWSTGGPAFGGVGQSELRTTRMYFNNGNEELKGPNAGEGTGSTSQGGNVYNYTGPNSNAAAQLANSDATKLAYIQSVDPNFEYCYGGCGVFLQGFNNNSPWYTGSDLGGGGGAQNSWQYGGSDNPYQGGRFGYKGGFQFGDAYGPMGGMTLNHDGSYPKGGGGSFGAGCGDAGNNDNVSTPGGGAILIRWDTTLATAQDNGNPGTINFPGKYG